MNPEKRLLLTGAGGFIGRAIAPMLEEAGWTVLSGERGRLIEQVRGCGAVVHLAGRAHVMREEATDPAALYHADNTELSIALGRASAAAGVRRFIFMSTAKVFGEGRARPYGEADPPAPEDHYARSKLAAEDGLFAIGRGTGMETVVLRPPLVYGPGVRANFLSLMKAVDRGIPLPLGAIDNRRSLISVANLGSAILAGLSHRAASGRLFAVSDGMDVSTPQLIEAIAAALGKRALLLPVPVSLLRGAAALAGRRMLFDRLAGSFVVDTAVIRATLGWEPIQSLNQGLVETARWYRVSR